jgi:hypothetical protein
MLSAVFHGYAVQDGALNPIWSFALFDLSVCLMENIQIWGLTKVVMPGLGSDPNAGLKISPASLWEFERLN